MAAKKSLPMRKKIYYALGQFGWSLILGLITTYLLWFYVPSAGEEGAVDTIFIYTGVVVAGLTIIGIIQMIGRLVDAVTDPWIATLSDRSTHKRGRRISFMMKGGLPFAICAVLAFWSPVNGTSVWNAVFLGVCLILMYIFYTMYVTPYFALVSEFGHTSDEKLQLSTFISATWFLGLAVATVASPMLWDMFEGMGFDRVASIRLGMVVLAAVGVIFMYIPVFTINEREYSDTKPSNVKVIESVKGTFKNKHFRIFAVSDLAYWFGLTIFSSTMMYYVTVLLQLDETWTGLIITGTGVWSFVLYPVVNWLARKSGKKKLLIIAYIFYTLTFVFITFSGKYLPFSSEVQGYIVIFLTGIPMAIFGILPNAIVADLAEYDARKTGVNREAMFFGARTFMSKLGQTIGVLLVSSLIIKGNTVGNDIGIRLTTIVASVLFIVSLVIFFAYKENEVLGYLKETDNKEEAE